MVNLKKPPLRPEDPRVKRTRKLISAIRHHLRVGRMRETEKRALWWKCTGCDMNGERDETMDSLNYLLATAIGRLDTLLREIKL